MSGSRKMKPFKPPSFKAPAFSNTVPRPARAGEPPAKRRRLSDDEDDSDCPSSTAEPIDLLRKPAPHKGFVAPPPRQPLHPVPNPNASTSSQSHGAASSAVTKTYYNVLWRKFTTKKNKTWDGDGVLSISGTSATLQDISGKELGRGVCKGPLLVGSELSIGGKEIEVDTMISREDYMAGRPFLSNTKKEPTLKEIDGTSKVTKKAQAAHNKLVASQKIPPAYRLDAKTSDRGKAAFKAPLMDNSVQKPKQTAPTPVPRFSVDTENALVMTRPKSVPKGRQIVDVVVDPLLTKALRPHQREGLSFLYECVMGMKDYDGLGAILADEMGLGKTLQTIALIWTLLKQSPIYGDVSVIKKALIVCPVTLINNWRKEIIKWLGRERIGVYIAEGPKPRINDFVKGRSYQVMIVGYEKLTKIQSELQHADIDLVICDEGHRLKTAANKAAAAIKSLRTDRRIILSGTPIQNDLCEFFTMVDFVNPSVMSNKYSTFKREFEMPILKSRQPGASKDDLEKGEARSVALAEITGQFILRRTSGVLSRYLPSKTEFVVFCRPSNMQKAIYRRIVSTPAFQSGMESPGTVLELINALKKVCNAPQLLLKDGEIKRPELVEGISRNLIKTPGISGKLQVLDDLLVQIYSSTEEKVVLVSNYTATLDLLAAFVASLGYSHLRLDGQTHQSKRQGLVDRFNRSPKSNSFVFLLSAKAGGVGINLIGASRLILFDCDWNPAVDLQAMARVHRDGQKRECFIYRLLTQGTLDEKIFQRQVSKIGLADSIVDGKSAASGFTQKELRDLFTLDEGEGCQTHRLLGCQCGGSGLPTGDEETPPRNDLATLSGYIKRDAGNVGSGPKKKRAYSSGKIKDEGSDDGYVTNKSESHDDQDDIVMLKMKNREDADDDHDHLEMEMDSLKNGNEHPVATSEATDEDIMEGPKDNPEMEEEVSEDGDEDAMENAKDTDAIEDLEDSDEDFELIPEDDEDDAKVFVPKKFNKSGSAADSEALANMQRKARDCYDSAGNAKFLSLMRYTHLDTSNTVEGKGRSSSTLDGDSPDVSELDTLELAIGDEVLRKVIRKDGRRIGFVLTKMGHDD